MISTRDKKRCVRALCQELTPGEQKVFDQWLESKPEHRRYYTRLEKTWSRVQFPEPGETDVEAQWQRFETRFTLDTGSPERSKAAENQTRSLRFPISWRKPAFGFALAAMLLLIAGLRQGWFVRQKPVVMQMATGKDRQDQVILSDGSHVYLNHATRIEYLQPLSDTLRSVKLQGEAYFEVQPGKTPFVVFTDQAEIRVLGTRFDVWARHEKTRVLVADGHVLLANGPEPDRRVNLKRGQMSQVIHESKPAPVRTFIGDSATYLPGWMQGDLSFYRMDLADIACELECHYGKKIFIEDSTLSRYSVTATFHEESLETVLESLALTLNMRVRKVDAGYALNRIREPEK